MSIISSFGVTVTNIPDRSDLRKRGYFGDKFRGVSANRCNEGHSRDYISRCVVGPLHMVEEHEAEHSG